MKKLISLALALALVFSLAIAASAEAAAITGTGTEEDPFVLSGIDGTFEITVPAATDPENYEFGMAFLAYPVEAVGLDLNANGGADSDFELSQGFNFVPSQDGVASISLSNPMMMGNIRITNCKTEELTLTLTITLPPVGSFGNPAALELGENTVTVDLFNGYFMTWTAPAAGTFSITDISLGAEDTEIDFYTINISGDTLYNSDNNVNEDTFEPTDDAVIEVDANETVSIEIYVQDYDGVVTTATITFTASFEASEEEPEASEPEASEPEATEPEATEPEATEPEATEPEATEPEATEPEASEPEADPVPPTADAGTMMPVIVALVAVMSVVALVAKKELF